MRSVALLVTALGLAAGCTASPENANPPSLDACAFERDVYPVLARDCGFPACHGSSERSFQVWAPGRTRHDGEGPFEPPSAVEIERTYDRARSVLALARTPEDSLLLRKPLAVAEGGAAHMGVDALGHAVYATRDAPGFVALATWARGESDPCTVGP